MAKPTELEQDLDVVEKRARAVRERGRAPTASLMIAVHGLACDALAAATTVLEALPPDERAEAERYLAKWKSASESVNAPREPKAGLN